MSYESWTDEIDHGDPKLQPIHDNVTLNLFKHAMTQFLVLCKYLAREKSRVRILFP
jgi:hypothetical protein